MRRSRCRHGEGTSWLPIYYRDDALVSRCSALGLAYWFPSAFAMMIYRMIAEGDATILVDENI